MVHKYVIAGSMIALANSLSAKVPFFRSTTSLLQVELKTVPTCVPAGFPPPGEQPREGSGNPSKGTSPPSYSSSKNPPPPAKLESRSKDSPPPSYRSSRDAPPPSSSSSGGAWPGLDSNPRQGLKQECLVSDGRNGVKLTKTLVTMEKLCFRAEIRMTCNGQNKWIGLGQMQRDPNFKPAIDAMSYDKFIDCQKVFRSFGISAQSKSDGINQMCQRA
ncbi:hypothetical protein FOL47_002842 [Perkinsus chesapeaki]|uniref:Uncharacterized protein n=1 Tax=Perkinsus chesapeaki TaxID=330153 RepID=A0A7J6MBH4_PERCH|nr:hypothetical protein FOL47_002842 [Perkinsus chesapeaki]